MITFKPIIIPNNKRQDGKYPVKIRVYHNGKCRRLPTTLVCEAKDLTRSLKIKNPDILKKADVLIIGGTSLVVYPAAGLVRYYEGNKLVVINRTVLESADADLTIIGSIGEVLGQMP